MTYSSGENKENKTKWSQFFFFKVQKHFSLSSDITQKKAQFFDHWFLRHGPEWYVLVVWLNKHARTAPTESTNRKLKITLDYFFNFFFFFFFKSSIVFSCFTYIINTFFFLKNQNIQPQVLEKKKKRYPLLYIIINTINIKRTFDIIYMVSKREGNGPSVRRVFTKSDVLFFLPEVEFCHLQFKVLLNILID